MREGQADPLPMEAAMSGDEVGRWPWLDPFLLTLFSLPIRHRMLVLVCWFGDLRAKADLQKRPYHWVPTL